MRVHVPRSSVRLCAFHIFYSVIRFCVLVRPTATTYYAYENVNRNARRKQTWTHILLLEWIGVSLSLSLAFDIDSAMLAHQTNIAWNQLSLCVLDVSNAVSVFN